MPAPSPDSFSFESQRLRLHGVAWGDPGAPPLVLVHGGRDHCRSWDPIAEALADEWRICVPDLRGHGDSEWSSDGHYSISACIVDLAALVERFDGRRCALIGHSLGGNIALRYAAIHPERVTSVVSIEGLGLSPKLQAEREALGTTRRLREWVDARLAAARRTQRRYPGVEAALERMRAANPRLEAGHALHVTQHGLRSHEDGTWSWKFDPLMHVLPAFDLEPAQVRELWAAIECPTLLCYGRESWASNPAVDGRAAHFRHARVVLYEAAGHWLHLDQPARFIEDMRAFLVRG